MPYNGYGYEPVFIYGQYRKKLNKMIEIRETTKKEKAKHSNMAYVIDLGHTKQWFTEKALVELLDKLHEVVSKNGLSQRVSNNEVAVCDNNCPYWGYQCNINEMFKECTKHRK